MYLSSYLFRTEYMVSVLDTVFTFRHAESNLVETKEERTQMSSLTVTSSQFPAWGEANYSTMWDSVLRRGRQSQRRREMKPHRHDSGGLNDSLPQGNLDSFDPRAPEKRDSKTYLVKTFHIHSTPWPLILNHQLNGILLWNDSLGSPGQS